jgi:hypothetical protein
MNGGSANNAGAIIDHYVRVYKKRKGFPFPLIIRKTDRLTG